MKLIGPETAFHNLQNAANLAAFYKLFGVLSYNGNKIAVEIMYIALRALNLICVKSKLIARSHGFCYSRGILNRRYILFDPSLKLGNLSLFLPILKAERSVLALHIEARKRQEIICSDFDQRRFAALKCQFQPESAAASDL